MGTLRAAFSVTLLFGLAMPAAAAVTPSFLSTQVNPFGDPQLGTGIAIYFESDSEEIVANHREYVTAHPWDVRGAIINHDTSANSTMFHDAPNVQTRHEALIADTFDSDNPGAPFTVNDSYWGTYFGTYPLGEGFQGSGLSNPDGSLGDAGSMRLHGGTTFGEQISPSELLLYLVITEPVVILEGEVLVGLGPSYYATLDGPHVVDLEGNITPLSSVGDALTPEPSAFGLALVTIAAASVIRRRRGDPERP